MNRLCQRRPESVTRKLLKILVDAPKDIHFINMATGLPNVTTFPFESIKVRMNDGNDIEIDGKLLDTALQYSSSDGYLPLRLQLTELQMCLHKPPSKSN